MENIPLVVYLGRIIAEACNWDLITAILMGFIHGSTSAEAGYSFSRCEINSPMH